MFDNTFIKRYFVMNNMHAEITSFILLEIAHAVIAAASTATYSVILRTKQKTVPIRSRR